MQPYRRLSRIVRILGIVTLALGSPDARGGPPQLQETDVAANSELELTEHAESGVYQRYIVRLTIRDSACALATTKDGQARAADVTLEECLALWRTLLDREIENLADATPAQTPPDQSRFTLRYRVGSTQRSFTVYGVDSLSDTRYRDAVRAIHDFARKYITVR